MTVLHVLVDRDRVGRSGGHEPVLLAEPRDGAVVHHATVLAQHHAVACAADGERLPAVGIQTFDETQRVGAFEFDLPERRDIAEPHRRAHGLHLADHGRQPVGLACARKILRTQPGTRLDEHCALLARPLMRGGQPRRSEIRSAVMAGERADGDRRVRWAIGRRADLADGLAGERRERREAVER